MNMIHCCYIQKLTFGKINHFKNQGNDISLKQISVIRYPTSNIILQTVGKWKIASRAQMEVALHDDATALITRGLINTFPK